MNIKLKFNKKQLIFIFSALIVVVLAIVLIVSATGKKANKGKDGDSSNIPSDDSTSSAVSSTYEPTLDDIKNWWENEAQVGQEGTTTVETK